MKATLAEYAALLPQEAGPALDADSVDSGAPATDFSAQVRQAGLAWRSVALLLAHLSERTMLVVSWACVGAGALSGHVDYSWLLAGALALTTMVPLHATSLWLQGVVAIGIGALLKRRLLAGAVVADADFIRTKGAGELMSEVFESEAIDDLGATGGLATLLALLDLLVAPLLLLWGAAAGAELAVLVVTVGVLAWLIVRNLHLRVEWTRQRARLTNILVENMTAHRTRVVQQSPKEWHVAEDAALEAYQGASARLDRHTVRIETLVPRGYVVVAFSALVPEFVLRGATLDELTMTLGMVLFAAAGLERFCLGYTRIAAAWAAWRLLQPMFAAAGRPPASGTVTDLVSLTDTVLYARDVSFAYPGRLERVLSTCNVEVRYGDRVLLEGPSGSGKSTLAAMLAGSRSPIDGFVLSRGLDRHTLGDLVWRGRIALAPQYHDNHMFAAPLSFNLLLGRPFPHTQADFAEAETLCRELGLGRLLDRMPAGIHELVGDTGWHLSQGERSRIYLARAILQRPDVVLLDETLAALDPESLRQCLQCVMKRAPTAIVIAHF